MKKQIKAAVAAAIPALAIGKAAAKEDRHFVTALARGLSVLSSGQSHERQSSPSN